MEYKITERKKEIKVKIFNIKLISKERKGTEAYIQLIERVFKNWPRIDVGSHRAIEFMRTIKDKDILLYYGQIIKYTILDDENWYNRKTNQLQSYEIDDDMYPNSVECKFFFLPEIHRFCYIDKNEFSDKQMEHFLRSSFQTAINESEELKIDIEVSLDAINEILSADIVSRLEIDVSYTNNDLTEDYEMFVDDDLKDTGVSSLHLVANSRKKSTLDLLKSKLLKGYLMLSRKNGSATATIKNGKKPRKKIITKDHPNRLSLQVDKEFMEHDVYTQMIQRYKSKKNE
ncbi:DUF4747 family protein [Parabacteroides goldsteinii]|uniref:DUF4747 family protein n=1 Tax=Parabacteroides goldsteinii TaxID=328812 RepID=UPI001CCBC494|nr:DUF4747 family protein [Parabacteroides goldsteinii]UBD73565.1 DUF4747 family protein [Parabacteroides goldsteinii]